ncbi:hypothetical protein HNY73_002386 [Argiope bruennichi]|uniref:Uncharacterized protein n=1 Tax=Argiope bruennichi TaxID=94029 RepID=A0A8T0FXM6_ARGBR|nr:hypothetical protein HNY73_002386 [Argiope bruennichi]
MPTEASEEKKRGKRQGGPRAVSVHPLYETPHNDLGKKIVNFAHRKLAKCEKSPEQTSLPIKNKKMPSYLHLSCLLKLREMIPSLSRLDSQARTNQEQKQHRYAVQNRLPLIVFASYSRLSPISSHQTYIS